MPLTRDQQRASHAYHRVGQIRNSQLKDYKVLVNSLGPNIIRGGLMAAIAFLQRDKSTEARERFACDLAEGLPPEFRLPSDLNLLARRIRELELDDYMLVTRETLKLTQWFKRALQAQTPVEMDTET